MGARCAPLLAFAIAAAGCATLRPAAAPAKGTEPAAAAAAPAPAAAPAAASASHGRPAMVMLPLENLSGRAEYGDRFTRLVWAAVGRTGRYDLADAGEVDATLVELRIRSAGSLTREQILKLAGRLKARWILAGTLLECGTAHTPDGDMPTFGLVLRAIDGRTGKVVWTDMRSRTGQDRETVFGWGREENLDRLADTTTKDLVGRLRTPEIPDSLQ